MTFFSSTDLATLKEEGIDNVHFVSLIVSNAGVYTAAITRKVTGCSKGTNFINYATFDGKEVTNEESSFEKNYTYIEYYPLDITVETVPQTPKTELEIRLEELQKSANSYINRKKCIPKSTTYPPYGYLNNIPSIKEERKEEEEKGVEEKSRFKEGYLFTEEEMDNTQELDPSIAYDEDHIDKDILHNTITQIITGDIFAVYKPNIDLNKWASNMENLYDKRFESDLDNFGFWIDSFLEILENELDDPNLISKGKDYVDAIWAYDVMVELENYPKNKYMDRIIDSFERWLI